jgi:hypothetical protein
MSRRTFTATVVLAGHATGVDVPVDESVRTAIGARTSVG